MAGDDSSERFEVAEHGWDQFGDGGVDVHGALQRRVGGVGVHDVEERVDGFVAAGAEDGGAEDLAWFRRRRGPS